MKPRKPDESDAHYIKRLEDQNANLMQRNKSFAKWSEAITAATTHLACEGSLAFQAMAEKAGVRGHPSVTEAVELFDQIAHPQYHRDGHIFPKVTFPEDWDLDDCERWSGDADMLLNAPIAEAIDLLQAMCMSSIGKNWLEPINKAAGGLQKALREGIDGLKAQHGFSPLQMRPIRPGHIKDMDRQQLEDLCSRLGWMALDLAQDMAYANDMLRRDLRAAVYRRVCGDLYALSQYAIEVPEPTDGPQFDVKVLGGELETF